MKCDNLEKDINKSLSQKKTHALKQAKFSAPISKTNPARLNLAVREQRINVQQLEEKLDEMRNELQTSNTAVDQKFKDDLLRKMTLKEREISPFVQLFW